MKNYYTKISCFIFAICLSANLTLDAQSNTKGSTVKKTPAKNSSTSSQYKIGLGLKAFAGSRLIPALNAKFFLKEDAAIETILTYDGYNDYGISSNSLALYALYAYHGYFNPDLKEFKWYLGAGPMAGIISTSGLGESSSIFRVGGSVIAGAEYKFQNVPLAVSLDWMPTYIYVPEVKTGNFNTDVIGIGVKYIIK